MIFCRKSSYIAILTILFSSASPLSADEGMWLFNAPPKKLLKEKYDFDAADEWLAHLRQSAVRMNNGGSGSFVSADGLVMTNHHVGADALFKLSTKERDLLQNGFYARTKAEELKCPDSELNVLVSIEDVTARVAEAVKPAKTSAEADKLRRAALSTIEKESLDATGLRSDVITLYNGGLYHLYRYKKYTDVRLVFAPEQAIAFFGGDPDNFEYPRCDLDVCFFRVYENGRPAKTPHYLKWNPASLREGDLTFIAGNPGHTERMYTIAHLQVLRDIVMPEAIDVLRRREVLLTTYSQRSAENARRARDMLFGIQNGRKARMGGLSGLQDPAVMKRKQAEEESLRMATLRESLGGKYSHEYNSAHESIRQSLEMFLTIRTEYGLLEQGQMFNSELFHIARTLVRLSEEIEKPNGERLREFRDSNLESLRQGLFSESPIYPDLETVLLADSLSLSLERTGRTELAAYKSGVPVGPKQFRAITLQSGTRKLAEEVLAGRSPEKRAAELVAGCKLADVKQRRRLAEGRKKAIEASNDPMIRLALLVDGHAREVRTKFEQQVAEPQRDAYGKLADLRFKLFGKDTYPDATFTLRLSFGPVKSGVENGKLAPAWTTFADLYRKAEEHGNADPYTLPKSWIERKDRVNMKTPLNFINTADIIGGNSGSPVVNRAGELVGIVFDGDMASLVWNYVYTAEGRSVAVHGSAILEALRKVYDAGSLADELEGKRGE